MTQKDDVKGQKATAKVLDDAKRQHSSTKGQKAAAKLFDDAKG